MSTTSWELIFFSFQLDKCKNNSDCFCNICGIVLILNGQTNIADFIEKAYCDYFGVKIGIKRSHSLHTFVVKHPRRTKEIGGMVKERLCDLPFQWSGGKEKITLRTEISAGPVDWGWEIHQLHLCRGVKLPQQVSWIWHEIIWWWSFSNADRVFSMCQIELNCVLMLNWIVWCRTVFDIQTVYLC